MKLTVHEDPDCAEVEVAITCREMDERVVRLVASLRAMERKLTGLRDGRTFLLDPPDVYYFESVDKRTFIYTAGGVYETPLRLYELEERFAPGGFFRASKSTIINLSRVRALNPLMGGKIEVVLENDERQMVNRQYAPLLRQKLGIE